MWRGCGAVSHYSNDNKRVKKQAANINNQMHTPPQRGPYGSHLSPLPPADVNLLDEHRQAVRQGNLASQNLLNESRETQNLRQWGSSVSQATAAAGSGGGNKEPKAGERWDTCVVNVYLSVDEFYIYIYQTVLWSPTSPDVFSVKALFCHISKANRRFIYKGWRKKKFRCICFWAHRRVVGIII